VRAPYRERPSHGAIEAALPRDALEDKRRDRDAAPRLASHHEKRGRRSAHRRKRGRDVVDLHPAEERLAHIDDDKAEPFAAQSRGRRQGDTCPPRAHDDKPVKIDIRTLCGERIERRRGIYPGRHPTLRLRGGGRTERELKLSNAGWADERDGLAGDETAANDSIE